MDANACTNAVLSKPLADLHREFTESTDSEISFSYFAKCRPAYIRPAWQNTLHQCLCEYCENVCLKIKVINNIVARVNNVCRIRHPYHAVDLVTCGHEEGHWHIGRVYDCCGACGPNKLTDHLRALLPHQDPVTWSSSANSFILWQSTCCGYGSVADPAALSAETT